MINITWNQRFCVVGCSRQMTVFKIQNISNYKFVKKIRLLTYNYKFKQ